MTVTRTSTRCGECANGLVTYIRLLFPFEDGYNWERNEATRLPVIGAVHQKWFVDLRDCCSDCCKDFIVKAHHKTALSVCCPRLGVRRDPTDR